MDSALYWLRLRVALYSLWIADGLFPLLGEFQRGSLLSRHGLRDLPSLSWMCSARYRLRFRDAFCSLNMANELRLGMWKRFSLYFLNLKAQLCPLGIADGLRHLVVEFPRLFLLIRHGWWVLPSVSWMSSALDMSSFKDMLCPLIMAGVLYPLIIEFHRQSPTSKHGWRAPLLISRMRSDFYLSSFRDELSSLNMADGLCPRYCVRPLFLQLVTALRWASKPIEQVLLILNFRRALLLF